MATRGSAALLARLNRLNRTSVFLGAAALVLATLWLPGTVGALALLALIAALAWLLSTTWPYTPPRMRAVRVTILTLLLVLAVAKLT